MLTVSHLAARYGPAQVLFASMIGTTITPPQYFDYLIELALKDSK